MSRGTEALGWREGEHVQQLEPAPGPFKPRVRDVFDSEREWDGYMAQLDEEAEIARIEREIAETPYVPAGGYWDGAHPASGECHDSLTGPFRTHLHGSTE